jgi:hypothetical protein
LDLKKLYNWVIERKIVVVANPISLTLFNLTKMDKKSFVFYTSWNEALKDMNDTQVRNFINNLCNYAEGKEVLITDLSEKILWSQVKPLLDHNETKRQKRIENGRKGGLSKTINTNQTQVDLSTLNSTNQTQVDLSGPTEEGRRMMVDVDVEDDGRRLKEDGRKKKLMMNYKQMIEEDIFTEEEVVNMKLKEVRKRLTLIFDDFPYWEDELNKLGSDMFTQRYTKKYDIDYCIASDIKAMEII